MNRLVPLVALAVALLGAATLDSNHLSEPSPAYTAAGELVFPADYRDWAFVTSGLGMSYAPAAQAAAMGGKPAFDNVFVKRESLATFKETGRWPDRTMFVIEVRSSSQNGSINKAGHFQNDLLGFDVEVKDSSVPGTWRYYGFAPEASTQLTSGSALPTTTACYTCHSTNAAVEHTFVQFYPALLPIAKAKGTINSYYHDE
jgi:Cytochrome P460